MYNFFIKYQIKMVIHFVLFLLLLTFAVINVSIIKR